jgi:hypothetical protein
MGIGAALQQVGTMYMQRAFQQKDQQKQQEIAAKQRQQDLQEWKERQEFMARLGAPQERVRMVYDEQLKRAVQVREQWQAPTGDQSQGPPVPGMWQETGRDVAPPAAPELKTFKQGDQEITALIDPRTGEVVKEVGRGSAYSPSQRRAGAAAGGGGSGRGKAPAGFRWTEEGDLEAIPGGPAAAKAAAAEAKGKEFSSSEKKNIASLRQSLGALDAIEAQLNAAEEAYAPLKGSFSAGGGGQGMLPTEPGKRFDAAVSQLAPLMRQLTRVPGEGAMSDYESKLLEQGNLNRGDYEATTAEKFKNLRTLVNEMRQSRASALDVYGPDAAASPKDSAAGATPEQKGSTKSNPVQISSEAEADKLPPGTWVILNGRIGQT